MDAVDDLRYVLLLIQVDQLEPEQFRKLDFIKKAKEYGYVIGVTILQLRMSEDLEVSVGLQCLHDFSKSDTVPQSLFELNDDRYVFIDHSFYPLLGFADMAQVFVSLKELPLLVHPVSATPAILGTHCYSPRSGTASI
jgi:hypothetical protein